MHVVNYVNPIRPKIDNGASRNIITLSYWIDWVYRNVILNQVA